MTLQEQIDDCLLWSKAAQTTAEIAYARAQDCLAGEAKSYYMDAAKQAYMSQELWRERAQLLHKKGLDQ